MQLTIARIRDKFETHGTVCNVYMGRSGRPHISTSPTKYCLWGTIKNVVYCRKPPTWQHFGKKLKQHVLQSLSTVLLCCLNSSSTYSEMCRRPCWAFEKPLYLWLCFNAKPLHLRASGSTQGGRMALSVVYFRITHRLGRPHYVWDEYLYSVREKVGVSVIVLCGIMMKGREKVKPGADS